MAAGGALGDLYWLRFSGALFGIEVNRFWVAATNPYLFPRSRVLKNPCLSSSLSVLWRRQWSRQSVVAAYLTSCPIFRDIFARLLKSSNEIREFVRWGGGLKFARAKKKSSGEEGGEWGEMRGAIKFAAPRTVFCCLVKIEPAKTSRAEKKSCALAVG